MVRLQAEEVRFLTDGDITELVAACQRGETMRSLAHRFGVHRTTISKHLERVGVIKRPKIKLTGERLAEAVGLYAQGWSTQRIARKLDLGQTTVYDALKNAGVQMRNRGPNTK